MTSCVHWTSTWDAAMMVFVMQSSFILVSVHEHTLAHKLAHASINIGVIYYSLYTLDHISMSSTLYYSLAHNSTQASTHTRTNISTQLVHTSIQLVYVSTHSSMFSTYYYTSIHNNTHAILNLAHRLANLLNISTYASTSSH